MNSSHVLLAFLLAGCGTDSGTSTMGECAPGDRMACDCSPTSTGIMTCGADAMFGTCGQCSIPDPDPQKVNFRAQIVPILQRSCGTDGPGCHARDAYGANKNMECRGWLALEDAALGSKFYSGSMVGQSTGCPDMSLYDRLMTIKVWQCLQTTAYYVKAGDPSKSYIMNKLNGVDMCKESATSPSDQMPPPQPENPNAYMISAADTALIQQWISEGALNN
jgi:hypothetical protein